MGASPSCNLPRWSCVATACLSASATPPHARLSAKARFRHRRAPEKGQREGRDAHGNAHTGVKWAARQTCNGGWAVHAVAVHLNLILPSSHILLLPILLDDWATTPYPICPAVPQPRRHSPRAAMQTGMDSIDLPRTARVKRLMYPATRTTYP